MQPVLDPKVQEYKQARGVLHMYVGRAPFERIAMDVAGPFHAINNGNCYILVTCFEYI